MELLAQDMHSKTHKFFSFAITILFLRFHVEIAALVCSIQGIWGLELHDTKPLSEPCSNECFLRLDDTKVKWLV